MSALPPSELSSAILSSTYSTQKQCVDRYCAVRLCPGFLVAISHHVNGLKTFPYQKCYHHTFILFLFFDQLGDQSLASRDIDVFYQRALLDLSRQLNSPLNFARRITQAFLRQFASFLYSFRLGMAVNP